RCGFLLACCRRPRRPCRAARNECGRSWISSGRSLKVPTSPNAIATMTSTAPNDPAHSASARTRTRALDPLRVIALFKFFKAAVLIATGYGVHLLLRGSLLERLREWSVTLTDGFAQRLLLRALGWGEGLGA